MLYCSYLSSSFKQFLELEPQLRDIMSKFYESKYASCLTLLADIKVTFVFVYMVVSENILSYWLKKIYELKQLFFF